jgi:hypothetical protein
MALKRLAQNPSLRGGGLAKAGLIIGYVALALFIMGIVVFLLFGARLAQMQMQRH